MTKKHIRVIGGRPFNQETGEEENRKAARAIIHQRALESTRTANEELRELGLKGDISTKINTRRPKNMQRISIKTNFDFNKLFRVGFSELMLDDTLSKNARCVIGTLGCFVAFPANAIKLEGSYPSFEDLRQLIRMSPAVLKKALAELEHTEVIKRTQEGGQYIVYFNPFLICGGRQVETHTYRLFKDSSYNPSN